MLCPAQRAAQWPGCTMCLAHEQARGFEHVRGRCHLKIPMAPLQRRAPPMASEQGEVGLSTSSARS